MAGAETSPLHHRPFHQVALAHNGGRVQHAAFADEVLVHPAGLLLPVQLQLVAGGADRYGELLGAPGEVPEQQEHAPWRLASMDESAPGSKRQRTT